MNTITNNTKLLIWIAENGDHEAKKSLCKEAKINLRTLYRILKGGMSRPEVRYRIYKTTGIKLNEDDNFPEIIPKLNAS